jgi:predicted Zn-dependent protease
MIMQVRQAPVIVRVLVIFFMCSVPMPGLRAQDNAGAGFKFTKVDTDLLGEVGELDTVYTKKGLVLENPAMQAYLDAVGKRLLGARPVPEQVEFRFKVLRDPMVNAFAEPNGTIYVTTGLLSALENEAELAGVLGHELTHVFNRHSYLENRSSRKKAVAINILAAAAYYGGSFAQGAANAHISNLAGARTQVRIVAYGAAVQLGAEISSTILTASIFGYSREMEKEADAGGLIAMTSASYDPRAMARTFELLDTDSRIEFEPIQGFYHNHPSNVERRKTAIEFASAHPVSTPRPAPEKEYLQSVSPAICYDIESDIDSRRARTALARSERLTTEFPDEPKYQVLLGESFRALGARSKIASEEELSRRGQAEDRKDFSRLTEEEEQRKLLEKPEGQAALRENQRQAESLYLAVTQRNPSYADAYRELGFLYEQQGKYLEAANEYRRYLELVVGTTLDHVRIERRLASVEKEIAPNAVQPH